MIALILGFIKQIEMMKLKTWPHYPIAYCFLMSE